MILFQHSIVSTCSNLHAEVYDGTLSTLDCYVLKGCLNGCELAEHDAVQSLKENLSQGSSPPSLL